MKRARWISILGLGFGIAAFAQETDPLKAYLMEPKGPGSKLPGLSWAPEGLSIRSETEDARVSYYVLLEGKYSEAGRTLISGGKAIVKPGGAQEFSLKVPVSGKITPVKLVSVGDDGSLKAESLEVYYPSFEELKAGKIRLAKPFQLAVGACLSVISYKQGSQAALDEQALTVKLSARKALGLSKWQVAGNAFMTALPLHTSRNSLSLRFFGINALLGYSFDSGSKSWIYTLNGGLYYNTSFGGSGVLGYENVAGPELVPVVTHLFANGTSASAYFKYALVSDGFSLSTLSNHEIALGASYGLKPFRNGGRMGVTLDLSDFALTAQNQHATYRQFSLGMSYEF